MTFTRTRIQIALLGLVVALSGCSDTNEAGPGASDVLVGDASNSAADLVEGSDEGGQDDLGAGDALTDEDVSEADDTGASDDLAQEDDLGANDDTASNSCHCDDTATCGEGQVCIDTGAGGECLPPAGSGECWWDADCPEETPECVGVGVCPCDVPCVTVSQPGHCALPAGSCCEADADCGTDMVCVAVGAGSCQQPAPPGQCWRDSDCGVDEECAGTDVCGCNMDCSAADSGTCQKKSTPPPSGCCSTDADCGDLQVCADIPGVGEGQGFSTCAAQLTQEKDCWTDADCQGSDYCLGAQTCPCGLDCGMVSAPGECTPAEDGVLGLVLKEAGGFAASDTTTTLDSDGMTIVKLGPAASTCISSLSAGQYAQLVVAAKAVDWDAVALTYKNPDNPFCCCDQIISSLTVTFLQVPKPIEEWSTDWCSESLQDGSMPQPLLSFIDAVHELQGAVTAGCAP